MGPTSKGRRSFLRSGPRLAFPFRRRIVISRKINLRASQSGFCQGNDECLAWISVTLIAWPTTACLTVRRLDTIISHPSVLDLPQAPAAALEAGLSNGLRRDERRNALAASDDRHSVAHRNFRLQGAHESLLISRDVFEKRRNQEDFLALPNFLSLEIGIPEY
jgi:hypothetical protein